MVIINQKKKKKEIKDAKNYGWEVKDDEAVDAYNFCIDNEYWTKEKLDADIVRAMGAWKVEDECEKIFESNDVNALYDEYGEDEVNDAIVNELKKDKSEENELAKCLAYIFRMNDFREWEQRAFDPIEEITSNGKENVFEMENGDVLYIGYDKNDKTLYCGTATNAGISRDYEIDYDFDESLDSNLERLYEEATENGDFMVKDSKPFAEEPKEKLPNLNSKNWNIKKDDHIDTRGWKVGDSVCDGIVIDFDDKNFYVKDNNGCVKTYAKDSDNEDGTYTCDNFPTWAGYYATYGEDDTLTEEEMKMVDDWMNDYDLCNLSDTSEETSFIAHPAFGPAADVYDEAIFIKKDLSSYTKDSKKVKDSNELSYNELANFGKSLYEYLGQHHIYPEDGTFENSPIMSGSMVLLKLYIDGDWKHDHLYTNDLVEEWCNANNYVLVKENEEEIGDSKTDDYEALHTYYIALDKNTGNQLVEMRRSYAAGDSKKVKDAPQKGNYLRLEKKKNQDGEYVVKDYEDGKFNEEGTAYETDWNSAVATFKDMAKRLGYKIEENGPTKYVARMKEAKAKDSKVLDANWNLINKYLEFNEDYGLVSAIDSGKYFVYCPKTEQIWEDPDKFIKEIVEKDEEFKNR